MTDNRLRDKALRLLAQREHSRFELSRKLAPWGEAAHIAATLDRLAELHLQSDARFAAAWVRSKHQRFGTARLRHDLAQRGVAPELIEEALAAEATDHDIDRARAIWQAKFGTPAQDRREWARQARFLQGRGFSTSVIRTLLKENPDESA